MRLNIKVKREPNFPVNLARIKDIGLLRIPCGTRFNSMDYNHMPGAVVICTDTKF